MAQRNKHTIRGIAVANEAFVPKISNYLQQPARYPGLRALPCGAFRPLVCCPVLKTLFWLSSFPF
jgi:hypothetical protein